VRQDDWRGKPYSEINGKSMLMRRLKLLSKGPGITFEPGKPPVLKPQQGFRQ
jgi:hypothetical protein